MKRKLFFYGTIFLLFPFGCEDIFVRDISDEQVVILSPFNDVFFEGEKILFAWAPLEGAEKYHVEIASPTFKEGVSLYDDVMDTTRVEVSLPEGNYQWSIYGYNYGYKSKKTTRSFEIKKDEK